MKTRTGETIQDTNRWTYALQLGFFAGLIWGGIKNFLYYLEFTNVEPLFLLKALFTKAFIHSWVGHLVGWGVFVLFSMGAALLYAALFYKIKGPWMGIAYGAGIWLILHGLVGPPLGMMNGFEKQGLNTVTTEICLYLMWGLFIGYSIAYEFNDVAATEPT